MLCMAGPASTRMTPSTRTPWEPLITTVLRLKRIVHRRDAATGFWTTSRETAFWVSSAQGFSARQWNAWVRGHWRIENGSHYVRDATSLDLNFLINIVLKH